ncbi:MAG: Transcriptional regulatory protein YycF [Alphaproteobacteria bacterium MarineAlpha10_Bin3]|jgi:DNA-binding response OmpR family regulator|nr:MAG: Transcriptional regulatory protein YycF [Alphaproteobacteria bacterium MarineAlpha10_Bin3]PPR66442.1 MAG: Transcriptional regulatory protein YycF [Alphaproteobacteria bacterium MarineAlpha4_Bin1]
MAQSVLIVEDELNIVLSLEFLVKQAGYDVRVVHDGEAALRAVEESSPALILLDIMIPKRNGYDVCRSIRANPSWNDIRILMLTAKGRDVEREKGMALGTDDYITKPFSTRELTDKVKHYLGGQG